MLTNIQLNKKIWEAQLHQYAGLTAIHKTAIEELEFLAEAFFKFCIFHRKHDKLTGEEAFEHFLSQLEIILYGNSLKTDALNYFLQIPEIKKISLSKLSLKDLKYESTPTDETIKTVPKQSLAQTKQNHPAIPPQEKNRPAKSHEYFTRMPEIKHSYREQYGYC